MKMGRGQKESEQKKQVHFTSERDDEGSEGAEEKEETEPKNLEDKLKRLKNMEGLEAAQNLLSKQSTMLQKRL